MASASYFSEFSFTLNVLVMRYPTLITLYCDTRSEKRINIRSEILILLQVATVENNDIETLH